MIDLVLIGAGESEYDGQGRIQGTLDVPLSALGRQQVQDAAEQLLQAPFQLAALYAGPCRSVRETAELLSEKLHLKSKTLDLLANLDHGLWQGMLLQDVKVKQPKVFKKWSESPDAVCPPEGESVQRARERLKKAFAKLHKKHKTGPVGVVMPRPMMNLARSVLRDQPVGDLWNSQSSQLRLWELVEAATSAES